MGEPVASPNSAVTNRSWQQNSRIVENEGHHLLSTAVAWIRNLVAPRKWPEVTKSSRRGIYSTIICSAHFLSLLSLTWWPPWPRMEKSVRVFRRGVTLFLRVSHSLHSKIDKRQLLKSTASQSDAQSHKRYPVAFAKYSSAQCVQTRIVSHLWVRSYSSASERPKIFSDLVFQELLQKEGREKALTYASEFLRDTAGPLTLSEASARVAYTFEKYFKRLRRSEAELRKIDALLRRPASEGFPQAQYLLGLTYQELAVCRERERENGSLPNIRELASPTMRVSNLQCFVEPVNAEPERVIDIVKRERCAQSAHDSVRNEEGDQDESRVFCEESFGFLKSAVDAGMVEARTALAAYYMHGIHPASKDATRALHMLMKSAKEGDSNAHVQMASYFRNMTPPNLPKALHHLKVAVGMGDMHAEHEMGCIYIMGELGQEIDYARGIELLEKAAEKGHPDSHFILARIFCGDLLHEVYDGPIFTSNEKFYAHLSTAVEAEHAGAVQFLAESIYRGNYKLERDYPRALRLLFDAAQLHAQEQNMKASGECLYTAGLMIYHGLGIQNDAKHAFFVMQAAHELGNISATRFLSEMYAMGEGVMKNEKMASFLAQMAELEPNKQSIMTENQDTFEELPSKKLS